MLALCNLTRNNPGIRKEYKCVNGPYTLYMNAVYVSCLLVWENGPTDLEEA